MFFIFRFDCEYINDVVKSFDWTFIIDYKGIFIENVNKKIIVNIKGFFFIFF